MQGGRGSGRSVLHCISVQAPGGQMCCAGDRPSTIPSRSRSTRVCADVGATLPSLQSALSCFPWTRHRCWCLGLSSPQREPGHADLTSRPHHAL